MTESNLEENVKLHFYDNGGRFSIFSIGGLSEVRSQSLMNVFRREFLANTFAYRIAGVSLRDSIDFLKPQEGIVENTLDVVENLRSIRLVQEAFVEETVVEIEKSFDGKVKAYQLLGKTVDPRDHETVVFTCSVKSSIKIRVLISSRAIEDSSDHFAYFVSVNKNFCPVCRVNFYEHHYDGRHYFVTETHEKMDHVTMFKGVLNDLRTLATRCLTNFEICEFKEDSKLMELGFSIRSVAFLNSQGIKTWHDLEGQPDSISRLSRDSLFVYRLIKEQL